jgi:aspartyl-tRNA(Asn)/glutamyl-tRNA(Gln) amidotransferase subunit C
MAFTQSDLMHVARLARLSLSKDEAEKLGEDLARIVQFVEQLQEVNVEGVAPMAHAGDRVLPFREDHAEETLGRDCVKSSAGFEDGLIRVPKIIE